jgi:hypothetical protein
MLSGLPEPVRRYLVRTGVTGGMMRYLSEMIFFPAAFVQDNISFQAVSGRQPRGPRRALDRVLVSPEIGHAVGFS